MITTHLRPTLFAEWLIFQWSRRDSQGTLRLPFADGRHAPIAAADQARVITAILTNPGPHDRQIYPLAGPVELNHDQIAAKMGKTLNIQVAYEPVGIPEFARALEVQGAAPFLIQHLSSVEEFAVSNRDAFDDPGRDATWATPRASTR
ncbi:MAG: hypothetical protein ACRDUX_19420 [Mycobacterium sp.]